MSRPRSWPSDPDLAPSADQIAWAFVAAARETGDVERLAAAARGRPSALGALTTRARWIALAALAELWPRCNLYLLGEKLGANATSVSAGLAFARRSPAWSAAALSRVMAAI
ncbi:MAG: hypothetical protein ACREEW_06255 [Caulobacteraceae bacterium]